MTDWTVMDWLLAVVVLLAGLIVGLAGGLMIRLSEPTPNRKLTPREVAKAMQDDPTLTVRLVPRGDGNPGRKQ